MKLGKNLAKHSRSLLECKTNNDVESFNSIVASMINGKRVNYTSRGSYHYRGWTAATKRNGCELMNA